jgi:asparagine synthase (glutamine-hydrolysing)
MSGLAGIFKFDRQASVSRTELMGLASGIDRAGPDGGGEYLNSNLGMAYRAFHTTPESYLESQPLVRNGCVLTWDGRLDNREEIRTGVTGRYLDIHTDLDLVFAAYMEWGTKCFAKLLGDWALALWDESNKKLLLARDSFGVRTLFYKLAEDAVEWCSVLEPLVFNAKRPLTLDLDHVAGCIYPYPRLGTTPYREIKATLPSHFITFEYGRKPETTRYWALNPDARVRFSSDAEYEENFRLLFRESVRRRMRSDRVVLSELSGGIDSSSIVCMADNVRAQEAGPEIATLSYYDSEEPSGDERPYISVIEKHRGRAGHHISVSDFNHQTGKLALQSLPDRYSQATPGYTCRSLRWSEIISAVQSDTDSRVILSGLGGDEFLGGVQYEALELAEHLFSGRLLSLYRSMFQWGLARNKTLLTLANGMWKLCRARSSLDTFVKTCTPVEWFHKMPAKADPVLQHFSSWRTRKPAHLCAESSRYTLASMLSSIDPPLVGMTEKRYPYLDRHLFEFMASIPRTQVIRPRERRSLMRRSLRGLVPDAVLSRKTKWFGRRISISLLRDQQTSIDEMLDEPWLSDGVLFDLPLIRERISGLQHGFVAEGLLLTAAIGIEQWLRQQVERGTIEWPSLGIKIRAVSNARSPIASGLGE